MRFSPSSAGPAWSISLLALTLSCPRPRPTASQDILDKGVVRIGVPVDVPPFGSPTPNREPVGLDVDLAGMVAKALGVEARTAADHRRQPHPVPADRQGRHRDRGDGGDAGARQADHVHLALCRTLHRRLRAEDLRGDLGRRRSATSRSACRAGTTQDISVTEMTPTPTSCASRTTPRRRRPTSQARPTCSGPPTSWSRTGQEGPEPGFVNKFVIRTQPGPHGRAPWRVQSAALARYLHLLQQDERRASRRCIRSGWARGMKPLPSF